MTATPGARLAVIGSPCFGPGSAMTSRTPGIFFAAVASNDFISPSNVGQRVMTATSAPGSVASRP